VSLLLERLRAALASDYEVIRELGAGGMGIVFLARDRTLDREVAIKIVDPSQATAIAAERFLREARILAAVSHPNIVPVHRAGTADGIPYYVMDYLEAPTLADRLEAGRLQPDAALSVADDILAALEAVHQRGMVHRDIKPSNIFVLREGRAVLTDFGIAKQVSAGAIALTAPGHMVGTPGYMPPEQAAGGDVGPRSDICATAMVIFEACTGRRWEFDENTGAADWKGVPPRAVPALRRAMAWNPQERWASAAEFRHALAGRSSRLRPGLAPAVLLVGATLLIVVLRSGGGPPAPSGSTIVLQRLAASPEAAWLAESLTARLPQHIGANPDFRLVVSDGDHTDVGLRLSGTVALQGDSVSVEILAPARAGVALRWSGTAAGWRDAAESLASQLVSALWRTTDAPMVAELPLAAAPRTARGRLAFVQAERLYAHAMWMAADSAYSATRELDPSCALCDFRRADIARWVRASADAEVVLRFTSDSARFTEPYRMLIRAGRQPLEARLQTLREVTTRFPSFHLGHLWRGDELYHRGPLAGYARSDALPHFLQARLLRPEFAPGLEHLAATAIVADSARLAAEALAQYQATGLSDIVSLELLLLDAVASVWRFAPAAHAAAWTRDTALAHPMLRGARDLADGAAYLMSFDVPEGVVFLGEQFAAGRPRPGLEVRGTMAQVHGHYAAGRGARAAELARSLRNSPEPGVRTWLAQLPVAIALAESAVTPARWAELATPLRRIADDRELDAVYRRRAAWMLALLARRAGREAESRAPLRMLESDPAAEPFRLLLSADAAPREERLARSRPLLAWDSASSARTGDPFLRAIARLMRARWALDAGDTVLAARELRWYENADYVGLSTDWVQSAEIDWMFGTLARWYRSRLLAAQGTADGELCRDLLAVSRRWASGERAARDNASEVALTADLIGCGP
jgi:hypothetical protein